MEDRKEGGHVGIDSRLLRSILGYLWMGEGEVCGRAGDECYKVR